MSGDAPKLTQAERLAVGGAVAATVRRQADAPRRITLIDKDGKPVGLTTSTEVAKSMLARSKIEFSVQEGKRPKFINCKTCGRPVKVERVGVLPVVCRPFAHRCPVCDKPMKIKPSVCGFGKTCKRCRCSAHIRKVAHGRRKFTDDDLRRVFTPEVTYEEAAAMLNVAPSVVYSRAKAIGLGVGRKRGTARGSQWSKRRRMAKERR